MPVADLADAAAVIAAHRIVPIVDRSFAMSDVAEAYAYLVTGGHFGKVTLGVD